MLNVIRLMWKNKSKNTIWIALLLGLLNGLVYIFLIPPWEHYDEPAHFEYSWLIANRLKLPGAGDFDQNLRLAVGQSLIETRFFERRDASRPNLTDPTQPLWIGVSQIVDPPLYYILTAVPLFLLQGAPVNSQLYSARLVSLLFLLFTIFSAYKITSELTPQNHALRWLVPIFIALLPSFVEFMTAVNDYPAAVGFISLWLLSSIRLIKNKWSIRQVLILLVLTIACLFTQRAVYYIVIFIPLIFIVSLLPRKKEWIGLVIGIAAGVAVFAIIFEWNDAGFWLRSNPQELSSRGVPNQGTGFKYALQGNIYPDSDWEGNDPYLHSGFFQLVPIEISKQLKGKQMTVGAWVWADQEMQGYGPGVNTLFQFQDQWFGFEPVSLSTTPQFVASVFTVPNDQERIQIWLRTTSPASVNSRIYFSGVVLAEGSLPLDNPPKLDVNGEKGTWGGHPFKNIARNSLFSQIWPYLRPEIASQVNAKIEGITPTVMSSFIALFLDYPGTSWYTNSTIGRVFRTFWATFSWGQVQLKTTSWFTRPYLALLVITFIGMVGSLIPMIKIYKSYRLEILFFVVVMAMTILVTFLYGVYTMGGALRFRAYLPVARYVFPVIIPISFVLVAGWHEILSLFGKYLKLPSKVLAGIGILFLIMLNGYSYFSIISFFS